MTAGGPKFAPGRLAGTVLLGMLVAALALPQPAWAARKGFSDSLVPVALWVQNAKGAGVQLAIPKAYFTWRDYWGGGVQQSIDIDAVFPEMTPYALEPWTERWLPDFSPDPYDPDDLHFKLSIEVWGTVPGGVRRIIEGSVLTEIPYTDEMEPGFRHYRRTRGEVVREYLIPEEAVEARDIYFYCVPFWPNVERSGQFIQCEVQIAFGDRLMVAYSIPRVAIQQWRAVDATVRALVRGFITGCYEGGDLKLRLPPARAQVHACLF